MHHAPAESDAEEANSITENTWFENWTVILGPL